MAAHLNSEYLKEAFWKIEYNKKNPRIKQNSGHGVIDEKVPKSGHDFRSLRIPGLRSMVDLPFNKYFSSFFLSIILLFPRRDDY